ncbi:hypothetical protein MMC24_005957 [Lignoscripta atroalba]|nr:hypothetical protein [Lignoscripta atroalba]
MSQHSQLDELQRQEISRLTEEIGQLKVENDSIYKERDEYKNSVDALLDDNRKLNIEKEELNIQNQANLRSANAKQKDIEKLSDDLRQLRLEKEDALQVAKASNNDLEKEISRLTSTVEQKQKDVVALGSNFTNLLGTHNQVNEKNGALRRERDTLESIVTERAKHLQTVEDEKASIEAELQRRESSFGRERDTLESLVAERAKHLQTVEDEKASIEAELQRRESSLGGMIRLLVSKLLSDDTIGDQVNAKLLKQLTDLESHSPIGFPQMRAPQRVISSMVFPGIRPTFPGEADPNTEDAKFYCLLCALDRVLAFPVRDMLDQYSNTEIRPRNLRWTYQSVEHLLRFICAEQTLNVSSSVVLKVLLVLQSIAYLHASSQVWPAAAVSFALPQLLQQLSTWLSTWQGPSTSRLIPPMYRQVEALLAEGFSGDSWTVDALNACPVVAPQHRGCLRLDTTNSDLPEGICMIADEPKGVYCLIIDHQTPDETVFVFEDQNIRSYDRGLRSLRSQPDHGVIRIHLGGIEGLPTEYQVLVIQKPWARGTFRQACLDMVLRLDPGKRNFV